jgi:hypothetical protein
MSGKAPPLLGESRSDVLARTLTTLTGVVPCVGPLIQIALSETIPNIRLDRIEAYLIHLQSRLDEATLQASLMTADGLDMFEEGMWQSARAFSDGRKQYIAELVSKGMASDGAERQESRHTLRILNQLDDAQIIILSSYQSKYRQIGSEATAAFYIKHRNILGPFSRELRSSNKDRGKAELKDAFERHLSSFGLLNVKSEDNNTGQSSYELTAHGRRLLEYIGISEN